jgi:hypothetical protein
MLRVAAFAALTLPLAASPALASVICVQQELIRLGFDPGPADGSLGGRTLRAAVEFQKGAAYFPDLAADTAQDWCYRLRQLQGPNGSTAATLSIDDPLANAGAISTDAMGATPIFGETPEYQVPKWVYR